MNEVHTRGEDDGPDAGDHAPVATPAMWRRRANLLQSIRQFFDARGFLEVDTPILSADVVVDRHLEPLATVPMDCGPEPRRSMWLQTSPEFAMKRMLVAGAEAIYQIAHVFRAGERGRLHNPEFTMLEWYRVGDDYRAGMGLLSDLAEHLFGRGPARQVSYRDAFRQAVGLDPLTSEAGALRAAAVGADTPDRDPVEARDEWLHRLWAESVEPTLTSAEPTIVFDWPASQAALACIRHESPPVAERFELFVDGIELANGYHELRDPAELIRRNQRVNQHRASDGKPQLPERSRLVEAMRKGLPPCCGVALGVDRTLMVLTGAQRIDEVLGFPIERA